MNTYKLIPLLVAVAIKASAVNTSYKSKVWIPDNGDGTYTNPVINADYSDPDVICVNGDYWFMHFQDKGVIGRVVHLNPMQWVDGWPVIGIDNDGDGCGEPVRRYRKPKTTEEITMHTPVESDDFDSTVLGKQWQWFANYQMPYGFPTPNGTFRLYGWTLNPEFVNMREVPNILTQKFPNEEFTATAKVRVSATADSQQSGLIVMGMDYARLTVEKRGSEFLLQLIECKNSEKGKGETQVSERVSLSPTNVYGEGNNTVYNIDLWLRVVVREQKKDAKDIKPNELYTTDEVCTFYYSTDGKKYHALGPKFKAREGRWIGARVGFFALQSQGPNRGWIDIDNIDITK